jgi:predicted amidohydrolase YtcJ
VRAAAGHRTPGSALTAAEALAAHTVGGHRAAGDRSALAGSLLPGAVASYAVWDGAGPLDGDSRAPTCLRTAHGGVVLHDALAETPTRVR